MSIKCPKCETENTSDSQFCKKCATPLHFAGDLSITKTLETPTEELTRGTLFAGRYEIIEELGAGGMGLVYRAYDRKMEEEVALKLIRPEISADKRTVERFRNEIKTARKIRHAHVCGMFDLHEENKKLFITMEYVRGEDLKSVVKRMKVLAPATALSIARQVAEGLGEAHRLGVVHRDLKPSNVMIDKDGNAKIMDFGIARSLTGGGITAAGAIVGTPEYMSPEQVEGLPADQRADLYALGIMLFEMVTGQPPFEGETPLAIAHKHKYEPPADPQTLNPQVPKDLSKFILRCLEKAPEKRYQTAEEFQAGLEGVAASLPTAERVPTVWPSIKRKTVASKTFTVKITPRKFLIPALALFFVIVGVLVIWRLIPKEPFLPYHTDKPSLAILHFMNNTGDESLDQWSTGLSFMIFHKLSQSKFLHVLPWDRFLSVLDQSGLQEARSYSAEDIKKLASYKIGKYFLSGNYFKAGENFQVYLTIQDSRTGKVIDYLTEECQGEAGIPGLIDRLSPEIKAALDLSEAKIAVDLDRSLGEMSTSLPEALKLFCEGTSLYLKGGEYSDKAIEKLKLAVSADPDFAMAYRQLAALYRNRGRRKEWSESWQKAMALKDRVSERERLFLEGQDYIWKNENENAVEVLTKLLERWPEDLMGNRLIALAYAGLGESDIVLNHLERIHRLWPENVLDCTHLANAYFSLEEYRKAEKILLAYLDDFSDSSRIRYFLSECYCLTGDFDLALQELEAAERLRPDNYYSERKRMIYFLKGDLAAFSQMVDKQLASTSIWAQLSGRYNVFRIHAMHGRFSEAKSLAMETLSWAEEKEMKVALPKLHLTLADVFLLTGDFQGALDENSEAIQTAVENNNMEVRRLALVRKGRALLALNSIDEARKAAEELAFTLKDLKNERELKIQYLLEGLIERESGNLNRAVELLEKAESCLSWHLGNTDNILYLESLAEAYYRSAKLASAKAKYEKISSRGFLKYVYPEIWVKSFYWLGRIAEERGKKTEARKRYQEFLEMWKDADPGLPEVEDAKKRLAGL